MATTAGEPQTKPSTISYVLGGLALPFVVLLPGVARVVVGVAVELDRQRLLGPAAVDVAAAGGTVGHGHPWRVLLLPAIAAVILFGGLRAGVALLGWTP